MAVVKSTLGVLPIFARANQLIKFPKLSAFEPLSDRIYSIMGTRNLEGDQNLTDNSTARVLVARRVLGDVQGVKIGCVCLRNYKCIGKYWEPRDQREVLHIRKSWGCK